MFSLCSLNGRIIPSDHATVSLANVEYAYGFGVYENIRVSHGVIYFLQEHAERLMHSASIIGLLHPYGVAQIDHFVRELLSRIESDALNLKILLIGGKKEEDVLLAILPLQPYFPEKKWYRDGVKAITVAGERPFPQAKTLSMLPSYLAYREARRHNAYDALLVDHAGRVAEGTRTNLLLMEGTTIVSPPPETILQGVTRSIVLRLAQENGFSCVERYISREELQGAEAAFLMSTSTKVLPLGQIDDHPLLIDERHQTLMRLYDEYLQSYATTARG